MTGMKRTSSGFWHGLGRFLFRTSLSFWYVWVIIILLLIAAFWLRGCRDDLLQKGVMNVGVKHKAAIDLTPQEVRAIKRIGQWEFLTIRTEELVEINEKGLLRDKQLARIYPGVLRIGIDLDRADADWFTARGDTAVLKVPRPALLDSDFIDETRVRAFYERGTWPPEAREQLYQKARRHMLERHLTPDNLAVARKNATAHFSHLFFALGFKYVIVSYQ